MLGYDTSYYYLYLPATIIYHDLDKLAFYPEIVNKYNISGKQPAYELYPQPSTSKILNKYAVGVSICELPFFLIAHWYCSVSGAYAADGYSVPYRVSIVFSIIFWVLAGLYALMKFLSAYFDGTITAITLLLILFATNLYFYTVLHIGMSHAFSFAFFCFILYITDRAYVTGKAHYIVLIGTMLGMITIIRPTNILVAMLPLLWPYEKEKMYGSKLVFFRHRIPAIISAIIIFIAIVFIQLSYLKYTSGHWFHFSYQDEGFNFTSPEIINGLFSYRKGWFLYTPVALLAVFGLIPLIRKNRTIGLLVCCYLLLNIYIVFSWCQWSYGGSFGCRALVESMAIMALPLAALLERVFSSKRKVLPIAVSSVLAFFVVLNVFQSFQISHYVILWDNMNKAKYWSTFGKPELTQEEQMLLRQ